ncbi:hypothetical protein H5410_044268 [Solanum commersonii]|uniref:Uncharacterized protein n=1 Tax=Solanum commersonii TaxID=4109 RepID=A0A9J5X7K1_SOLCO|nr:hypothetical protein H5410_044268 [Solanum commersonii]
MLFAIDIKIINETRRVVNVRLEVWKQTLESKGFRLSKIIIEYLRCKFSDVIQEVGIEVRLDAQSIPKKGSFKYLRSLIEGNREINDDVTHYIDKIRNDDILDKMGVASVLHKLREARLRWFGHVNRRYEDGP